MNIPNYDNWKLSSGQDDEKVFCHCYQCGREIYDGEDYYSIDGDNLHDDCIVDYIKENVAERKTAMV